jgi:hypothetical protein
LSGPRSQEAGVGSRYSQEAVDAIWRRQYIGIGFGHEIEAMFGPGTTSRSFLRGRIGRRHWYKLKRLGYPDSGNSWAKKKDISPKIVAGFEVNSMQVENMFEFEELVAKKATNDVTWYKAEWQEQPDAENKATAYISKVGNCHAPPSAGLPPF